MSENDLNQGGETPQPVPSRQKPMGAQKKKLVIWGLVLAIVGLVLWRPVTAFYMVWIAGRIGMTEAVDNRPLGYFYRFTANFSHKGEPLNFNYVVACNIRITAYRGGGSSDDSTYAPKVMVMPTRDGAAVMVRTINACRGQTTAIGEVPQDLFPMAIWFDDVNDITFGWGYATEDAYENALSQLKFHEAKIEAATREDWDAWRETSSKDFQPVGMIITPWGVNYSELDSIRHSNKPYDASKRVLARNCFGYFRLKLPENIRADISEHWPDKHTRYWSPPPEANTEIDVILRKGEYPDGKKYVHYLAGDLGAGSLGLPRRNGNGTLRTWGKVASDVYPILPRSRSTTDAITGPAAAYPRRLVYDGGRMKGYLACGGDAPFDKTLPTFDPAFRSKLHPIYVDNDQVVQDFNPLGLPVHIFDRDEYVFRVNPAGRHAP